MANCVRFNVRLMRTCHGCLSNDRTLSPVGDYAEMLVNLLGVYRSRLVYDIEHMNLCWECIRILKKFKSYQNSMKTAQAGLLKMMNDIDAHVPTLSRLTSVTKKDYNQVIIDEKEENIRQFETVIVKKELDPFESNIEMQESTIDEQDNIIDVQDNTTDVQNSKIDALNIKAEERDSNSTGNSDSNIKELFDIEYSYYVKDGGIKAKNVGHCSNNISPAKAERYNRDSEAEQEEPDSPPQKRHRPSRPDKKVSFKSKEKYATTYEIFTQWQLKNDIESFSEDVFLKYFKEISKTYKPSSLWCTYSMLKSTVKKNNNIDLHSYRKLNEFLRKCSEGFVGKKSNILSPSDVERFLREAPDQWYLSVKVALIFGVTGGCMRHELCSLKTKDLKTDGETLYVTIHTEKRKPRIFTVTGSYYDIVKKYIALRKPESKSDRFFQHYHNGKCSVQPIGINKFGSMPKMIAKYLNLPDPESYTGHSFKRTSATFISEKISSCIFVELEPLEKKPTRYPTINNQAFTIDDSDDNDDLPLAKIQTNVNSTAQNMSSSSTARIMNPSSNLQPYLL